MPQAGDGRVESDCSMGTRFLLGVLELDSSDVAQYCEYAKSHRLIHFKMVEMVNFMLHEFYLKRKIFKNTMECMVIDGNHT